jgi:hypothetical protein
MQWFALSPVTIIPLCFLSAECVDREPRLASIGMYSLAIYFLWFFSAH